MNRSRALATFALALLLAGGASLFVLVKLQQSRGSRPSSAVLIVASRTLEAGAQISEQDVTPVRWGGSTLPEGAFTKREDVAGRAVLYPTAKGEAIVESRLAPKGSGTGLPPMIPRGMRAVSIRVDDVVAVAGFVGPGARVDVLLTGKPQGKSGGDDLVTKTILENVQVLAAGQKIRPDADGKPEKVNVVTLLCSTEDGARLILAANEGRIQLALRNPSDTSPAEFHAPVARDHLYGSVTPREPAPARRPQPVYVRRRPAKPAPKPPLPPPPPADPPMASIVVIAGGKFTTVQVPKAGEPIGGGA